MKMDLRTFQRNFRSARKAADRGETVEISSREGNYRFVREPASAVSNSFADLEQVFGAVQLLPRTGKSTHEIVRERLQARRSP